jgi:hypothetical protein
MHREDNRDKKITCFLPKGAGRKILELLNSEKNINSINIHSGRGLRTVGSIKDYGAWIEQDILTVVVGAGQADEIFEFIFFQGELNKPGAGFLFQTDLYRTTPFSLPALNAST